MTGPERIYRKDYTILPFKVPKTDLIFELDANKTKVTSKLKIEKLSEANELILNGENLTLLSLHLDDKTLTSDSYKIEDDLLIISADFPSDFVLTVVNEIDPSENLKLMGLYLSGDILCTQMESEGFRRVTYYLDRPDILSCFTTKIIANKSQYPLLLSNGNKVGEGDLENGMHYVEWEDPFPKPCYLFALVAGDLGKVSGSYNTTSGRDVLLEVYVDKGNEGRAEHALVSLQKAMKWDEDTFGLEYDLDLYMIVAVDAFNFGAMENKGLNIFNSSAVLADKKSATDKDYQRIEGIVAHEYFHNWTGNRVTCRDWFQLTLKEGLTVFRDQEFSACMHSASVFRINDVRLLREGQFAEDSGPNSHPIRPDSYIEINNFYTQTVYEKGAEVIRMYDTILGKDGFRKGMDLYFKRHDGSAVCTDDFVAAMADANHVSLDKFEKPWYSQKGTPEVDVDWRLEKGTLTLNLKQNLPIQENREADVYEIPVRFSILDGKGGNHSFNFEGKTEEEIVLNFNKLEQEFSFESCPEGSFPSVFRQFSAPVKIKIKEDNSYLLKRLKYETDPFNAYEAGQIVILNEVKRMAQEKDLQASPESIEALLTIISRHDLDDAIKSEMLTFPSLAYILDSVELFDPEAYKPYLKSFKKLFAKNGEELLLEKYHLLNGNEKGEITTEAMGQRALKNTCLAYLSLLDSKNYDDLAEKQFFESQTMTDKMGALMCLVNGPKDSTVKVLSAFEKEWSEDSVVMNKWFAIQAGSDRKDVLEHLNSLKEHPSFDSKNPNKIRSMYGFFMRNLEYFHHTSGSGYKWVADAIISVDKFNSGAAAGLSRGFSRLSKCPEHLQTKMKQEIERVLAVEGLSPDTYEILSQTLATISS